MKWLKHTLLSLFLAALLTPSLIYAGTSIWDQSTTAASNTTVGGVSIAEGMPPSNVNDGMRAMIAQTLGAIKPVSASGTDTYTATVAPAPDSLLDGYLVNVQVSAANTVTTPTLQINSLAAKTIVKEGNTALVAGDLPNFASGIFRYSSFLDKWILLNPAKPSSYSGTATVSLGGTGLTTITSNAVLIGNGTSPLKAVTPSTSRNALMSDGTNWVSRAITSADVGTISGTFTAGTPLVMYPYTPGVTSNQGHGLSTNPILVVGELENLVADLGWAPGEKIRFYPALGTVGDNTQNVLLTTVTAMLYSTNGGGVIPILNRTTLGNGSSTSSRWKLTLTPYGLN